MLHDPTGNALCVSFPVGVFLSDKDAERIPCFFLVPRNRMFFHRRTCWLNLFSAILQYAALKSMPIKSLPNSLAIFVTVPLPLNGSTIKSPLFVVDRIILLATSSGIGQLWEFDCLATFLTWFTSHQS